LSWSERWCSISNSSSHSPGTPWYVVVASLNYYTRSRCNSFNISNIISIF
jgi:hypothetical protein